jgi:transposase
MPDKRRWLPPWQRMELVALCLDQGMSRREAAAWRRVSVSTVQYWIGRFGAAEEGRAADGSVGARSAVDAAPAAAQDQRGRARPRV